MLVWLGGKQKLVEKAKARQRVRAAAAAAAAGGGSGGSSAFPFHASRAETAASRPIIKRRATDKQEPAPTFLAAMPAPGAQRGGRPPLAPAPSGNREPRQPRLKRVKASLDLVALEMPAWQPMGAAEGQSGSEGAAAIITAGSGSGGGRGKGGEQAEEGGGTQEEPQRPPAAAMQVP